MGLKIVISGPQGSGKTRVAEIIVAALLSGGFKVSSDDEGEEVVRRGVGLCQPQLPDMRVRLETRQETSGEAEDPQLAQILSEHFHALSEELCALNRRRSQAVVAAVAQHLHDENVEDLVDTIFSRPGAT